MNNKTDFLLGIILIFFSCIMLFQINNIPISNNTNLFTPKSFPFGVACALIFFSCILMINSFKKDTIKSIWPNTNTLKKLLWLFLLIILDVISLMYLEDYFIQFGSPVGSVFYLTTFLFLVISQFITGYKNIFKISLIAFIITTILYGIFVVFFNVPLP